MYGVFQIFDLGSRDSKSSLSGLRIVSCRVECLFTPEDNADAVVGEGQSLPGEVGSLQVSWPRNAAAESVGTLRYSTIAGRSGCR